MRDLFFLSFLTKAFSPGYSIGEGCGGPPPEWFEKSNSIFPSLPFLGKDFLHFAVKAKRELFQRWFPLSPRWDFFFPFFSC